MIKKTAAISILFAVSLSLLGCQPNSSPLKLNNSANSVTQENNNNLNYDIVDKGPVRGGVLNLFSTTPDSLNPILTNNIYVSDFLSFVYEGLVKLDEKQQPIPELSDKWTVSTDGTVWNFHIRDGVKWHDGQPFTAADVEFTVESLLNNNVNSIYKSLLDNVATFAAVDPSNFKMVLRKPNSFTAECMTFSILPKHQFKKTGIATDVNIQPIGTGPYKFNSSDDKKVVLTSDENWWYLKTQPEKADSMMYINEIDIKLYKTSEDEMGAFQTGEIDAACINNNDFGRYSGRTDLIMHKFISRDFEFLSFNLNNPIFSDQSVRDAIAASINKKQIISSVFKGNAIESDIPIIPASWALDGITASDSVTGNVDGILLAGGWKNDANGYYKHINGIRKYLNFEILVNSNNGSRVQATQKICEQLNAAGIKAKCTSLDWNELNSRINTKKFDMAYQGVRTSRVPDVSYLYSYSYLNSYISQNVEFARNISGYSNTFVTDLITRIFSENNVEAKKSMFKSIKLLTDADKPYIGLYFLQNAVIYRKELRGKLNPYVWDKYNDITLWYKTELQ